MNALFTGRIQKRKTNPLHHSHLACNTRPVQTDGSFVPIRPAPESLQVRNGLKAEVAGKFTNQNGCTLAPVIIATYCPDPKRFVAT
jgi:hypothetical protein